MAFLFWPVGDQTCNRQKGVWGSAERAARYSAPEGRDSQGQPQDKTWGRVDFFGDGMGHGV